MTRFSSMNSPVVSDDEEISAHGLSQREVAAMRRGSQAARLTSETRVIFSKDERVDIFRQCSRHGGMSK